MYTKINLENNTNETLWLKRDYVQDSILYGVILKEASSIFSRLYKLER